MKRDYYEAAVKGGHLDCLRYLHENGCELGEGQNITSIAGRGGHLECLKFLLGKGFEIFEEECFYNAASYTCEHISPEELSNRLETIEFIRDYFDMSNDRFQTLCAFADSHSNCDECKF